MHMWNRRIIHKFKLKLFRSSRFTRVFFQFSLSINLPAHQIYAVRYLVWIQKISKGRKQVGGLRGESGYRSLRRRKKLYEDKVGNICLRKKIETNTVFFQINAKRLIENIIKRILIMIIIKQEGQNTGRKEPKFSQSYSFREGMIEEFNFKI